MLIQLIAQHPSAISSVLKGTPTWVWGLLAALMALGISQVRTREVSLARTAVMPLVMSALSLLGTASAFGGSPLLAWVLVIWAAAAALMARLVGTQPAPSGTRFDAGRRSFHVPGSVVPLMLITGLFMIKYIVGVDLAMQPSLARDGSYALVIGALYGLFSGTFAGRTARLWRLARGPVASPATAFTA
ncbi:hypothetical protein BH11PSE7_BH11PSE7_05910 [soil metagenome]